MSVPKCKAKQHKWTKAECTNSAGLTYTHERKCTICGLVHVEHVDTDPENLGRPSGYRTRNEYID